MPASACRAQNWAVREPGLPNDGSFPQFSLGHFVRGIFFLSFLFCILCLSGKSCPRRFSARKLEEGEGVIVRFAVVGGLVCAD